MAVGLPAKTTYVNGDVFSASDINDTNGTLNLLNPTAKGSIVSASAANTPSVLSVGNNGETLVADSTATSGLRWQGNFAAGKNAILNGDFGIWQRGTTFTSPATTAYTADRFQHQQNGTGTVTITQQAFTAGAAPVAGYEGTFFLRQAVTATGTTTIFQIAQKIEDVRTFAGQTITLSFWAKADTTRTGLIAGNQLFGTGGSTQVSLGSNNVSLTTSWQRFSYVYSVPSVSGKTIGAGSSLEFLFRNGGTASGATLDLWGVQVEAGSVATAFETATGTLEGELGACQRYYWRSTSSSGSQTALGIFGTMLTTTTAQVYLRLNTPMRVAPTAADFSTIGIEGTTTALTAVSNIQIQSQSTNDCAGLEITSTGLTAATFATLRGRSGTAFLGLTAEL